MEKFGEINDPFKSARESEGFMKCPFQGKEIHMILRHKDVRAAAKDWKSFSSDAPFRVPIPSEEDVRSMRQLPIETNPPEHTEYRAIVEPFFQRSKSEEVIEKVDRLIAGLIELALNGESVDMVREFALPLQSHALTYLLNVDAAEAEKYIGWGVHVFRDGDSKGDDLESYLSQKFDAAEADPDGGDDFFRALTKAEFRGRSLTREEMMGFANLTFAGGRDTVIHSVTSIIGYFAHHPESLETIRQDPRKVIHASEEFFRAFMPLTHIGRVCPEETEVNGQTVKADERISLCWVSANQDSDVFDQPESIKIDRKPNPHVSFGFGAHICLGAPHARLITRSLIRQLADKVQRIEIMSAQPHIEREATYTRENGFDSLEARFFRWDG